VLFSFFLFSFEYIERKASADLTNKVLKQKAEVNEAQIVTQHLSEEVKQGMSIRSSSNSYSNCYHTYE
jgi:hypothetical protein